MLAITTMDDALGTHVLLVARGLKQLGPLGTPESLLANPHKHASLIDGHSVCAAYLCTQVLMLAAGMQQPGQLSTPW
jgi:hypothetical protein